MQSTHDVEAHAKGNNFRFAFAGKIAYSIILDDDGDLNTAFSGGTGPKTKPKDKSSMQTFAHPKTAHLRQISLHFSYFYLRKIVCACRKRKKHCNNFLFNNEL